MESPKEGQSKAVGDWFEEIRRAEKDRYYSKWVKRCEKIVKRYRDERAAVDTVYSKKAKKSYNIFYSNVQTLAPAIYTRVPSPQVERRFKDSDPVGRAASTILERALDYSVHDYDFDSTLVHCRDDYLLTGFGQGWVEYEATFGPMLDPNGKEILDAGGKPEEKLATEKVLAKYIHWKDFLHNSARVWHEVTWVGRKLYLCKEELLKIVGPGKESVAESVTMNYAPEGDEEKDTDSDEKDARFNKAIVYEIWDKKTRTVYWLSKGYKEDFLKVQQDPLGLDNFFPCPKPMLGLTTSDSVIPIPDFAMYQDQAAELDEIATRKTLLLKAIRVVGIYDPSREELARLLDEADENQMVPAQDWAGFAAAGGLKGSVDFLPLEEAIRTLMQLNDAEDRVKGEIYEITGIADIIRGNSSPSETATAQQIKGQFATLRISDRQRAFQRFARDIIAIKGEIIAEKFQPETIASMVGLENLAPDMQQGFAAAVALLRDQVLRSYRIDIETDSTIAVEEQLDKQSVTEFLSAVGPFMQQSIQTIQQAPAWADVISGMLTMVVRRYKAGRALEGAIGQALQATQQQAQQAQQNPPPDPAMIQAQTDQQVAQSKMELEQLKTQNKSALEQQKAGFEASIKNLEYQLKQTEVGYKAAMEQEKLRGAMELQAAKAQIDLIIRGSAGQDSENERTIEDLGIKNVAPPVLPPIIVNVDAKQSSRKIGTITRTPDGNSIVHVADAPEESVTP